MDVSTPLEESFKDNLLKRLFWVCNKHLESKAIKKRRIEPGSSGEHASNDLIVESSNTIATVFDDFLQYLQDDTSSFNTLDAFRLSTDILNNRRDAICYCMWNRLPRRRYKNVYFQLLRRRLNIDYHQNEADLTDGYLRASRHFKRSINVWGHHLCLGEVDLNKSYNEPPEVHVLRFDKTGNAIITGGDEGIIKIWHTFNCKLIMSLRKHTGGITSIDVHDTNSFIVSTCDGGELWIWEINGNFYRPHKVIKISFKYLWARFTKVTDRIIVNGKGHVEDWNEILKSTRIVAVDANSRLYVYDFTDLLTSSSGTNIYTPVTPLYMVDLFNHNINAYDISRTTLKNGSYLVALGIEPPMNDLDIENEISIALNLIKNEPFGACGYNTLYTKFTNSTGFCLFSIDTKADKDKSSDGSVKYCLCDVAIENSLNYSNLCKFCNGVKQVVTDVETTEGTGTNQDGNDPVSLSTHESSKASDSNAEPESRQNITFLWNRDGANEFEKYLNNVLIDVANREVDAQRPNCLKLTSSNMPIGRLSSTIIVTDDDYLVSDYSHDADPGDFDTLLFSSFTDLHRSSPDVCFANLSLDLVTASDDGKAFIWRHINDDKFKKIPLVTKTLDKWHGNLKDARNGEESVKTIKPANKTIRVSVAFDDDAAFVTNDKLKELTFGIKKEDVITKEESTKEMSGRASLKDSGQLYMVVNLSWSVRDRYVFIADSIIGKSNIKKIITSVRTIYSGISVFKKDGKKCTDLLHGKISYHVSAISPHPKCEDIIAVATYGGDIFVLNVSNGNLLNRLKCGSHAIWLDLQWNPQGHIFAASQKFGCFSIFSLYDEQVYKNTPNYQCGYTDFYCNIHSFSTSAYGGPEQLNLQLGRYYYGFSSAPPLTLDTAQTHSNVQFWGTPPVQILLDECKNPIEVVPPTPSSMQVNSVGYSSNDLLVNTLMKLPFHTSILELINAHGAKNDFANLLKSFISLYLNGKTEVCHYNGLECTICNHLSNTEDFVNRFDMLKDTHLSIKSMVNEQGDIINALPPYSRPPHLVNLQERNAPTTSITTSTISSDRVSNTRRDTQRVPREQPMEITIEEEPPVVEDTVVEEVKPTSGYSFRQKRGSLDYKRDRELDLAKKMCSSMGPILLPKALLEDSRSCDNFCVFCGLGASDYSHGVTSRLQSLKLSQSLFKQKHSIHPGGSSLSKNMLLGPYNLAKRFITQLEELPKVAKRLGALKGEVSIYTHASCLVASTFLKLDPSCKRVLNLIEILARSSHVQCTFCDESFATIHCSNDDCINAYHYPCALACYKKNSLRGDYELFNVLDPLTCDSYVCIDCIFSPTEVMKKYLNFVTGSSYSNLTCRRWLYDASGDRTDNCYMPQLGDLVVLMSMVDHPLVNVSNLWDVTDLPRLYIVKDIDYQFTGPFDDCYNISVVLHLECYPTVESQGVTLYFNNGMPLILFRDLLLSIYRLLNLSVDDEVLVRINDLWTRATVKNIRHFETFSNCTEYSDLTIDSLDSIVKNISSIGDSAIQVEYESKLEWVSIWDVYRGECDETNKQFIKNITRDTLPQHEKEQLLQITLHEKYKVFENIIETDDDCKLYLTSIVYPLGMKIIRQRILNDHYKRSMSIYSDLCVLIRNCKEYNVPNSDLVKLIKEVEKDVNDIIIRPVNEYDLILKEIWPHISSAFNLNVEEEEEEIVPVKPTKHGRSSSGYNVIVKETPVYENRRFSARLLENTLRLQQIAMKSRGNRREPNTRYNLRR